VPEAPYAFTEGDNAAFSWEPFAVNESKTAAKAFSWLDEYITDLAEYIQSKHKINQTWLFGFSQGAYFSYILALKNPKDFDGVIACGGGLITKAFKEKDYKASKKMKILISHGTQDKAVAFEEGQKAYDLLKNKGLNVTLQSFEGGHTVDPKVFKSFREMIK
jgi:predicted esterase